MRNVNEREERKRMNRNEKKEGRAKPDKEMKREMKEQRQ